MIIRVLITIIFLTGIFFNAHDTFSQVKKKLPIPGLFNTGVDNNKFPIADGESDPHYILSISADGSYPGPEVKVVYS